jgi:hypothetical protein
MPSSSSSTFVERVGFKPRMPMLGRRPKPSSSRTFTPEIFLSASLVVKTRLFSKTCGVMTSTEPGMRSNASGVSAMRLAETATDSAREAGASVRSTTPLLAPGATRTETSAAENPPADALRTYSPCGRFSKPNEPDASVVAVRSKFVDSRRSVTVAPATVAEF